MKVYVKTDEQNRITAVNSSAFIDDLSGWTEIDEGEGDKYNLSAGNYFPLPLIDEYGVYRYKLKNGAPTERTEKEISNDTQETQETALTFEMWKQKINADVEYIAMMNGIDLEV